jgi:Flp pilus assembly protein TadG
MMHVARRARSRERRDRGAAAVEFALVVPLLIMLVFGIISFGIVFAQKLALGNGAREAARFGVVDERSCAEITDAARDAARTIALDPEDVEVTVSLGSTAGGAAAVCAGGGDQAPCEDSSPGDSIWVQLEFTSELLIPLVVVNSVDLEGLGVFRCEFS